MVIRQEATPTAPVSRVLLTDVVGALEQRVDKACTADRERRHSNSASSFCIWIWKATADIDESAVNESSAAHAQARETVRTERETQEPFSSTMTDAMHGASRKPLTQCFLTFRQCLKVFSIAIRLIHTYTSRWIPEIARQSTYSFRFGLVIFGI